MDVIITLIVTAILIVLLSIWLSKQEKKKLPPGPYGLPIVGYLPFITKNPHIKLTNLSKTYGPLYRLKLGTRNVIILTDFKLIKEAFAKDAFIGRPSDIPFHHSKETIDSKAFIGLPWKEMRRFSLHQLRDLGFGKSKTERHLKEEIEDLVERLKEIQTPIRMSDILASSTSNNIASFVFGNMLKYDDPKRQELDKILSTLGKLLGSTSQIQFFPWIGAICEKLRIGDAGRLVKAIDDQKKFCREEVSKHEATLDSNSARDFVDGFLMEMKKNEHDRSTIYRREVLIDMAVILFGAGSETVRITVDWLTLVVSAYPHVQKKIQDEIDEVLGKERFSTWEDRHRMPYTEAVIFEIMRWQTGVPISIMRSTLIDTELHGYSIPKNSRLLAVFWAVDHDKSLWGDDVFEFKPERFLSEDGKKVIKPEYFMPFSTGKRSCPGKSLAEVEVFLYVTTLLQKFNFSLPPGKQADFEGEVGIGLQPKRQPLYLTLRQ